MTRQDVILKYTKVKHTSFVSVPQLKEWLKTLGEPPQIIDSVLRVLRYDKTKEIQFAKKIVESPPTYQIIKLSDVEPKEQPKTKRELDEERSKYNSRNFWIDITPAILICNYCGSELSASYYSPHVRLHSSCPKCSHLRQ